MTESPAVADVVLVGFPNVELLDLAGPYEVFTTAAQLLGDDGPRVRMAAPDLDVFRSRNGLAMAADLRLDDVDAVDLLVIPGGRGVNGVIASEATLARVGELVQSASLTLSVCTGALILGRLGLLDGRRATTHHMAFDQLVEAAPGADVVRDRRWVEDERFVISAGVASGIDAAFHVVERIWGAELADESARHIEYPWTPGDDG